jgi:hypothetical protein
MKIIKQESCVRKNYNQSWIATYECSATNLSSNNVQHIHENQVLRLSFGFKAKDRIEAEQIVNNFGAAWFMTKECVTSLEPINKVIVEGTKQLEQA